MLSDPEVIFYLKAVLGVAFVSLVLVSCLITLED